MEQNYIDKQVKNQIQLIVRETNSKVNHLAFRFQSKLKLSSIFIIPNKGKGPPGRMRSPGYFPEHPPDEVDTPDRVSNPVRGKSHIFNSIQFLKTINSNFLSQLNFTKMKKQILFLAFFILAALASISDSYGQTATHTSDPRPLTGCADAPLHPLPGKEYQYVVSNPAGDAVTTYQWWATKDPNFIDATGAADLTNMLDVTGGQLISKSTNYGAATAVGSGGSTVSITWSPQILANTQYQGTASISSFPSPTFVVVKAEGSCTNNLQVYEISPLKAFTVDIKNWDPATSASQAYDATASSCVDEVRGASYDSSTHDVLMDYGTNTITFEVVAANFVTDWLPSFRIEAGLTDDQTAQIGWAYTQANAEAGTWIDQSATGLVLNDTWGGTVSVTTSETNTALGVSIWVSVVIKNNTFESLANQPFTLAVDGKDSTGQWDLTSTCTDPAGPDYVDVATHVILPRPTIHDDTVDPLTDPDTFIPLQHP